MVKKPVIKEKKAAPAKDTGFFVYLGPSIRGVIQTATIYTGTPFADKLTINSQGLSPIGGLDDL